MADLFVTLVSVDPLQSQTERSTGIPRGPEDVKIGINAGKSVSMGAGGPIVQGHKHDGNTVALWRFDETDVSAPASDEMLVADLTAFGTPTPLAGKIIGARQSQDSPQMYFQGYGNAELGACFNGDWSVEMWVYITALPTIRNLFIYNGLNFSIVANDTVLVDTAVDTTGGVFFHVWHNYYTAPTQLNSVGVLSLNNWHHVGFTREKATGNNWTYKIYIDGALDSTATAAGLDYAVPGDFHYVGIGNYVGNTGFGTTGSVLDGRLDDTRVSNIARTPAEILESYQRGMGLLP